MAAEPKFWERRQIYVDQGPMNYRWKHGAGEEGKAGSFRWARQLHAVRDASGERLCGLARPHTMYARRAPSSMQGLSHMDRDARRPVHVAHGPCKMICVASRGPSPYLARSAAARR